MAYNLSSLIAKVQTHVITGADVRHTLSVDTAAISQTHTFSPADVRHVLSVDGATLTVQNDAGYPTVKVGGTFVTKPLKLKVGGAFVTKPLKRKVGSEWVLL